MPRRRPTPPPQTDASQRPGVEPNGTLPGAASDPGATSRAGGRGASRAAPGWAVPGWSPRDMLIPYVLLAVSMQRAHGYLIEEYLKGLGFFGVEMSTLYRTLRQMEKDGLLLSAWEPGPTGPARRVYSLTDAGRAWLDSWAAALDAYRGMIDQFFGLYTGAAPGPGRPAPPRERTDQEGSP